MSVRYIYIESDFRLDVTVTDADDAAVTDAVVTATIKDLTGTLITGSDITLAHDSGGVYKGWMPKTLTVAAGTTYMLNIIVVADGKQSSFKEPLQAFYKGINSEISID